MVTDRQCRPAKQQAGGGQMRDLEAVKNQHTDLSSEDDSARVRRIVRGRPFELAAVQG